MRKIRKRIFAVTLAAAMLFTMPGTVSYAEQAAGDLEPSEMEASMAMEPEEDSSLCRIEELIAALPGEITEDNGAEVRVQLDKILALYGKLTEEEQEQIDISRCMELQEALDAANAPTSMEEPTEGAVAKVEKEGEVPTYTTSLADAFTSVQTGGTITLLTNVELTEGRIVLNAGYSGNITLNLNGHVINSSVNRPIWLGVDVNLTICGSGNIETSMSNVVYMNAGTLTLAGGSFSSNASDKSGISVIEGTLNVTSDSVTIDCLYVDSGTVVLTAGKYTGSPAIETSSSDMLRGLLDSGCAYYKDNQPLALSELTGKTLDGPVTVGVCEHPGVLSDNGDGTHGGDCPYCGTKFDTEPHTDTDGDSKCDGCKEQLATKVSISGNTTYYTTIETAWDAAKGNIATVTLLDNVAIGEALNVTEGDNITFDGGEYTLTCDDRADTFYVAGGTLTIIGGTITSAYVVEINSGTLAVTGGKIEASQLGIMVTSANAAVHLSGGTITGGSHAVSTTNNNVKVSDFLLNYGDAAVEKHYAYYDQDGAPVTVGLDETFLPAGTYMVAECTDHVYREGSYKHTSKNFTHTQTCAACGGVEEVDCCYSEFEETTTIMVCVCEATLTASLTGADGLVYTGEAYEPEVSFMVDGEVLREIKVDKTYGDNINAGTGTLAVMSGDGVFEGRFMLDFTIAKATPEVTWDGGNTQTLSYTRQEAAVTANVRLVNNETGTVSYSYAEDGSETYTDGLPTDAGAYRVKASFAEQQNYVAAEAELTLTISPKTVNPTIILSPDTFIYSDSAKEPVVTVKDGETVIPASEYTVEYSGNVNAGTATVTVKDKDGGNYEVVRTTEDFTIDKAEQDALSMIGVPSSITYGDTFRLNTSGGSGTGTVSWSSGDVAVDNDGNVAATKAGQATITATKAGDNNYNSTECSIHFTIDPALLTEGMVELVQAGAVYNGTAQKPVVTVQQGEATLTEGTDYEVNYLRSGVDTTDFTNIGSVKIIVVGKGNYEGEVAKTFTIRPAAPVVAWGDTAQTVVYTGQPAAITPPDVTLVNGDQFSGSLRYSYRKQGETSDQDGLPTDAGNYTVKAHIDAEGNYAAADSANELTLTINKKTAVITVGTDTYRLTYGDPAFTLDVTDDNPEADVRYAVSEGTDIVSVSNGTVTIQNAGTAVITVSLPESANYNAAEDKAITVNVEKKNHTISALDRGYLFYQENTDTIDLGVLLPKDCGSVTWGTPATSGNAVYSKAPAVNDGKLSYTISRGNINDEGTITVTLATQNYVDMTVTVKVKLTDQIPVKLKEGTEVILENDTLTYGEPLSKLVFGSAVFVDNTGGEVPGTLSWKDALETPDAGATSAVWVFTPAEPKFMPLEGFAAIKVNKAVPTVSEMPAVADRIYHPSIALKDGDLSGGAVTGVDGALLEGAWGWQGADIIPAVDNSGYTAVFAPRDTTNYEAVAKTIPVNVTKAVPYISGTPAAAGIIYGDALSASVLSGGTVQYGDGKGQAGSGTAGTETVTGAFTWKESVIKPTVVDSGNTEYAVIFTPSDTMNYETVECRVTLDVQKAENAPNMPDSAMDVPYSTEKVGNVILPEGWEWQETDRDTALEAGESVTALAVYTGADQGNYEKENVTVAITRAACEHAAGDILYIWEGEKEPTCTEDGLGHRECTKCGAVIESGMIVEALGHTGGTATCSQKAVCDRCSQPYGDTDGNRHGDTEVRGYVEATCTTDGYSGDTYCKDCGASLKAGTATSALEHDYTSEVTTEPTADREGVRTYTCTRCGYKYAEAIPKLPDEGGNRPGGGDNEDPGDNKPGEAEPDFGIPFLKGEAGKTGWDVIRAEEEQVQEGSTINVDMNGSAVVPGDIFGRIKGRGVTITFDMGRGILWSVGGRNIAEDQIGDIDFSVRTETNAIPADIVSNVAGENYRMQLSLAYEGEFGFTAVLSLNLGRENAGRTARLYYYNESIGQLELTDTDDVKEDGMVEMEFTHASNYVIVVDAEAEDEEDEDVPSDSSPESPEQETQAQSPQTGQSWRPMWIAMTGLLAIIAGAGAFLTGRKRKE